MRRRRPSRYDLPLDVWYRGAHDRDWHLGVTRSVSTNGALIEGDEPASLDPVVVVIALPAAACLVGRGRVLRKAGRNGAGQSTFAIAVERYRIERRAAALAAAARLLQKR